jgi:hypothetical protein
MSGSIFAIVDSLFRTAIDITTDFLILKNFMYKSE